MNIKPKFETKDSGMFYTVTKVDNPFLTKLLDVKCWIVFIAEKWWVMGGKSHALFEIKKDVIHLEVISTPVEDRNKGHATRLMKAFIAIADATKTPITLQVSKVTLGWGNRGCIPINLGASTKGKIPVAKLTRWYKKFGFEVTNVKKREMIYQPK